MALDFFLIGLDVGWGRGSLRAYSAADYTHLVSEACSAKPSARVNIEILSQEELLEYLERGRKENVLSGTIYQAPAALNFRESGYHSLSLRTTQCVLVSVSTTKGQSRRSLLVGR